MSRSSLQRQGGRGAGMSFLAAKIDEKNRLKEAVGVHRTGLPPHLLQLFGARPMPPHMPPMRKRKPTLPLTGVASFVEIFAEPTDPEYEPPAAETRPPEPRHFRNIELARQVRLELPTRMELEIAQVKEAAEKRRAALEEGLVNWDPSKDANIEGDPYKTLFVGRLPLDITERKLRREFEEYGPIKRVTIVQDQAGKPRGYAFVEFEHKSDMKEAYKRADGRKIEGQRCVVDVERGRTVPEWRPRRLGGGKRGASRLERPPKDPRKVELRRAVLKAAGIEEAGPSGYAPPERDLERERDRDRGDRGERARSERPRDVSARRREGDHRGEERRDRDRGRSDRDRERYRDRDRSERGDRRDGYRSERKRDRRSMEDSRGRERGGYGDDGYNAVPPPGYAPPPAAYNDEPEEGEFIDERGDAKRPREHDY